MQIHGGHGGHGHGGGDNASSDGGSSGHKRCDFLRIADDKSLLMKNPVMICESYKPEYLESVTGNIQTKCQWSGVDGKIIFCLLR